MLRNRVLTLCALLSKEILSDDTPRKHAWQVTDTHYYPVISKRQGGDDPLYMDISPNI